MPSFYHVCSPFTLCAPVSDENGPGKKTPHLTHHVPTLPRTHIVCPSSITEELKPHPYSLFNSVHHNVTLRALPFLVVGLMQTVAVLGHFKAAQKYMVWHVQTIYHYDHMLCGGLNIPTSLYHKNKDKEF